MPKTRVSSFAMSLDGFAAGPNQSLENPLGVRGPELFQWFFPTRTWRQMQGLEGGSTGTDDEWARRGMENIGAWILGRNMFGPVRGPWTEPLWNGWWGEEPPFHAPVFVLTHHEREPLTLGETTFHFLTEGPERAVELAREAAGAADVSVGGGGETIQQLLRAGLLDELVINQVPLILGGGTRLLDGIPPSVKLEQTRVVEGPEAAHLFYSVKS